VATTTTTTPPHELPLFFSSFSPSFIN
jgi:hypothetical protein